MKSQTKCNGNEICSKCNKGYKKVGVACYKRLPCLCPGGVPLKDPNKCDGQVHCVKCTGTAKTASVCGKGYTLAPHGDTPGWGKVGGYGGGRRVANCGVCAANCNKRSACHSFECSPTKKRCNLNTQHNPVNRRNHEDYKFCMKDPSSIFLAGPKRHCPAGTDIGSPAACKTAYDVLYKKKLFKYPAKRGLVKGSWPAVPLKCSIQYQDSPSRRYVSRNRDNSPHWNFYSRTNNYRLRDGEFRTICQRQGGRSPSGKCKEGDVRIRPHTKFGPNIPLWPEIFHAGKFYPICGHYFWDSDDGANTVCKMIGFSSGKRKHVRTELYKSAMPVGRCGPGQKLTQCNKGGNKWGQVGAMNCRAGTGNVGVQVICRGGNAKYTMSCEQGKPQSRPPKPGECVQGDVRMKGIGSHHGPMWPLVWFNGKFHPICGHSFWDGDVGATKFCQLLGFARGRRKYVRNALSEDAMPVGKCNRGEMLNSCSAGGNAYGNLHYRNAWCKKGKRIGVQVICSGGANTRDTSCKAPRPKAPKLPTNPVKCARERETCACSGGEARYGKRNQWSCWWPVKSTIGCNNSVFGDPIPGIRKDCWCRARPPKKAITGPGWKEDLSIKKPFCIKKKSRQFAASLLPKGYRWYVDYGNGVCNVGGGKRAYGRKHPFKCKQESAQACADICKKVPGCQYFSTSYTQPCFACFVYTTCPNGGFDDGHYTGKYNVYKMDKPAAAPLVLVKDQCIPKGGCTCAAGKPTSGVPNCNGRENCVACNKGYTLDQKRCARVGECLCTNGVGRQGRTCKGQMDCAYCFPGFHRVGMGVDPGLYSSDSPKCVISKLTKAGIYYMEASSGGKIGATWLQWNAMCKCGGRRMCKKKEICQNGNGKPPVGANGLGRTGENIWVPVADLENEWVLAFAQQRGDKSGLCFTHSEAATKSRMQSMKGISGLTLPGWGQMPGNSLGTRVACCGNKKVRFCKGVGEEWNGITPGQDLRVPVAAITRAKSRTIQRRRRKSSFTELAETSEGNPAFVESQQKWLGSRTGSCHDGDVRIRPNTKFGPNIGLWPEVFHAGKFYPICGHYFWDSDDGANTVCKMIGFRSGKRKHIGTALYKTAMPVGRCGSGQKLTQCTRGGNKWGQLGAMNCGAGTNNVGVHVICSGGNPKYTMSCEQGRPQSLPPAPGTCVQGDVKIRGTFKANTPMWPEVWFEGKFHPICGHYFWDNNDGPKTVCQRLGFRYGNRYLTRTTLSEDAMPVGKCKRGEMLNSCSGGENGYGNLHHRNRYCTKGKRIGVKVTCWGGRPKGSMSCSKKVGMLYDVVAHK